MLLQMHIQSLITGYYLHLCQAFSRKRKELGLKKAYENNYKARLSLQLIPALNFVPTQLVKQSLENIVEKIEHVVDDWISSNALQTKSTNLCHTYREAT